ncbi:MAG: shikimate dehydrogenase [Clostridiales bacterium]|nr:shikimate dehydrogenase [Clostridiales bacterium]
MEFGLIGEKLGHSYSPQIHRCFGDYDYQLYPMSPEKLRETLEGRAFKGLNITIPYKKDVLPWCDEISDTVQAVGSANTLVMRNGRLCADNTDLPGFLSMLDRGKIPLNGKKVVILGSGGTSLTAQAACKAMHARETVVVSRSGPVDYDALYRDHTDAEVLINTTPVGMYPHNLLSPVDIRRFPQLCGVADVIYNPARTALILDARALGIPCIDGLWMLVAQAWHAAQQFLGREIPEKKIEEAYRSVRKDCLNLVLVGMPGCGKTTLGRMAAEMLGKAFIDLDAEIEKAHGPIPAIFANKGEAAFRDLESEMCQKFGKEKSLVIATGGGAVLRQENIRALCQNGVIGWVQRPLNQLGTAGRPLSQGGMEALERMWLLRRTLYHQSADFSVENTGDPANAVQSIVEGFHEAAGD